MSSQTVIERESVLKLGFRVSLTRARPRSSKGVGEKECLVDVP